MVGFCAVHFGLSHNWEKAILCTCLSCILDILDGKVARMLNATSSFGIELDSLSDMVSFGVSPAVLWYLWSSQFCDKKLYILFAATFYIACAAIRLAKFNVLSHQDLVNKFFFLGVPVPVGAIYLLIPIVLNLIEPEINVFKITNWYYSIGYVIVIGVLLASRVPTFAVKSIKIPKEYIWISFLAFILLFGAFIIYPYHLMCLFIAIYTLSIIFSTFLFYKK